MGHTSCSTQAPLTAINRELLQYRVSETNEFGECQNVSRPTKKELRIAYSKLFVSDLCYHRLYSLDTIKTNFTFYQCLSQRFGTFVIILSRYVCNNLSLLFVSYYYIILEHEFSRNAQGSDDRVGVGRSPRIEISFWDGVALLKISVDSSRKPLTRR